MVKTVIWYTRYLDQVVREEGEVDKMGGTRFLYFFQFPCMLASGKSYFFHLKVGQQKRAVGFVRRVEPSNG